VTIYGVRVLEALVQPRTLAELVGLTGFGVRYVIRGIGEARTEGHVIVAMGVKVGQTIYRRLD